MYAMVGNESITKLYDNAVSVHGVFYTDIALLSDAERTKLGIFPVQFMHVDVPEGYLGAGSSLTYFNGVVYEVPLLEKG